MNMRSFWSEFPVEIGYLPMVNVIKPENCKLFHVEQFVVRDARRIRTARQKPRY
jgi:hypothetical protein